MQFLDLQRRVKVMPANKNHYNSVVEFLEIHKYEYYTLDDSSMKELRGLHGMKGKELIAELESCSLTVPMTVHKLYHHLLSSLILQQMVPLISPGFQKNLLRFTNP